MKKIIIFGSTGSVGQNALKVIGKSKGKFKVTGLCANRNIKVLLSQIKEFSPSYVCVRDQAQADKLGKSLEKRIRLFKGEKGLEEFAALESDISFMAISGISCLKPLLINIKYAKRIALANKESVVAAGPLVFKEAKKFHTEILPVDSEINALFQLIKISKNGKCMNGNFRKVYLTASGGALADYTKKELANVGIKQVLAHPTWKMGKRITVDSATLVNKAFEVIETHYFFGIPFKDIGITIHKESAVHALVEFKDNTLLACIYPPDMRKPISFALHYPQRFNSGKRLDFSNSFSYSFSPINYDKYPLIEIVLGAAKRKDNGLVVLNACDEVAIDYFLGQRIKFTDIYKVMAHIYSKYPRHKVKNINDVFFWDNWARIKTKDYLKKIM